MTTLDFLEKQKPNIIYISRISPYPPNSGGNMRTRALLAGLSKNSNLEFIMLAQRPTRAARAAIRKHADLTVIPFPKEGLIGKFRRYTAARRLESSIQIPTTFVEKSLYQLVKMLERKQPELIILGDTVLSVLIPRLRTIGAKIIVDTHNVESRLFNLTKKLTFHPLKRLSFMLLERDAGRIETTYLKESDAVWAVSESDAMYYRQICAGKPIHVVPNVIDEQSYDRVIPLDLGDNAIVFTGWYRYRPNEDAALTLFHLSDTMNQKGIRHTLYLVGKDPTKKMIQLSHARPHVVVTGTVPDVKPYISGGTLFVAPLKAGSGTKLKLIEAMALSCPIVTTPIGSEGLSLTSGVHAAVTSEVGLYDTVRDLLSDADSRSRMALAARELFRNSFSQTKLDHLLRTVLQDCHETTVMWN